MKPLKIFIFLNIVIVVLAILAYFGVTQFVWSDTGDSSSEGGGSNQSSAKTNGIVINSLIQPSLEGKLLFYTNGYENTDIIEYKLSSGREKKYAQLGINTNFAMLSGEYIYWVEFIDSVEYLYRAKPSLAMKEELLYKSEEGTKIVGVKVFSADEIYLTSYTRDVVGNISQKILKIQGKKQQVIKEMPGLAMVQVVAGKDAKSTLVLQNYDLATKLLENVCSDFKTMKPIGCERIEGTNYIINTALPDDEGYALQQKGYIDITDKKGVVKRVVEGAIDEHFESAYLAGGKIYFISGQITQLSESAGMFQPLYLESIDTDGKNRAKIQLLPSVNMASIEYVDDKMILLTLSEKSNDKSEIVPQDLWVYNTTTKELEVLTDAKCTLASYCGAVFLTITK